MVSDSLAFLPPREKVIGVPDKESQVNPSFYISFNFLNFLRQLFFKIFSLNYMINFDKRSFFKLLYYTYLPLCCSVSLARPDTGQVSDFGKQLATVKNEYF